MRVIVCLLSSIAIGFATYVLGAVLWAIIDPLGAGRPLLFTIPMAIVGMATPALLATLILIYRSDLSARRPVRKRLLRRKVAVASIPEPTHAEPDIDLQLAAWHRCS